MKPVPTAALLSLALVACGGMEEDPRCTAIKDKVASCSLGAATGGAVCSAAALENLDQLLAADCSDLQEGKADRFWWWGGCDPGFHRCDAVLCCPDEGYLSPEQRIVNTIRMHEGTPYVWGGCSWTAGVDCSCFVQKVFREAVGVELPRTVEEQWQLEDDLWEMNLQPGDLVFFNFSWASWFQDPTHVGIYVGEVNGVESFAHATSKHGVTFAPVDSEYWDSYYKGARRILEPPGWW